MIAFGLILAAVAGAQDDKNDWPMWRRDAARGGRTTASVPDRLHLLWSRTLPPPRPAYRNPRLQFDRGYEPVVAGRTLFIGSSRNDRLTAYATEDGRETWRFYAEGPIRFAPVVWRERVFVASDDGRLYCLAAGSGEVLWSFQAVPASRRVLGNGRLISVWPVRGGPVVADGRVYFAAGVWPFEGVFVYALDALTGDVVWLNDRMGNLYGDQPHAAQAMGGLTPQGYLVVNGDDLIVPCGSAMPAIFDRRTGAVKAFSLPKEGRVPGGWYVQAGPDKGPLGPFRMVKMDRDVARERHEDKVWEGPGEPGLRSQITTAGRKFFYAEGLDGVQGRVHTMLAADGKLFVVTEEGKLLCFGGKAGTPAELAEAPLPPTSSAPPLDLRGFRGYAVLWGGDGLEALAASTELRWIAVDPDPKKVAALRRRLDDAGLYGTKAVVHVGEPATFELPPYFASVVVCADPAADVERLFAPLRPFGGAAFVARADVDASKLPGARVSREGTWTRVTREGALPGSSNYVSSWEKNGDERVKAPLGVLWFDDTLGHFKRSPQPVFVDGLMLSQSKNWKTSALPYTLAAPVVSDVYTGRVLEADDPLLAGRTLPKLEAAEKQPDQYRPPTQKNAWKPEAPRAGDRINPLTGVTEPRTFPKDYGCDGGVDYGHVYTMRSATPAFYDKRLESGTIHVSGPRSGCTNSLIPANGLLNVPYFYEGCSCSYPLPVGLALVSLPPTHEQWAVWGPGAAAGLRRVGLNLGAPGDRMSEAGTLWLDVPSIGGPSPALDVVMEPEKPDFYYRHSLWIRGGRGWPWVAASGARGLRSLTLKGLRDDLRYTLRLVFAEPDVDEGKRVFDIRLQGKDALRALDVAKDAGGRMRALTKEFSAVSSDGTLRIELVPGVGEPVLSGVEVVAEGLPLDPLPELPDDPRRTLFRP